MQAKTLMFCHTSSPPGAQEAEPGKDAIHPCGCLSPGSHWRLQPSSFSGCLKWPFAHSLSGKCCAGAKLASGAAAAQQLPQQWGLRRKLSSRRRTASAGTSPVRVMSDLFAAAQKHSWAQQLLPAGSSQAADDAATGADADWGIAAVCAPLPGPSAGQPTASVPQQDLQNQPSSIGLPKGMVPQEGLQEQLIKAGGQADIRRLSSAAASISASTAAQAQQRQSRSFSRQDRQQPQQQAACNAPCTAAGEHSAAAHLDRQPSAVPNRATSRVSDGSRWATAEQHVEVCSSSQQSNGSASGALGTGLQGDLPESRAWTVLLLQNVRRHQVIVPAGISLRDGFGAARGPVCLTMQPWQRRLQVWPAYDWAAPAGLAACRLTPLPAGTAAAGSATAAQVAEARRERERHHAMFDSDSSSDEGQVIPTGGCL